LKRTANDSTDTVDDANSKGVTDANVTHPATGNYCFYNLGFTPKNVVVTAEFDTGIRINTASSWEGAVNFNCPGSPIFSIQTQNSSGTATNTSLYVLIN
jgi:hypothetical protein